MMDLADRKKLALELWQQFSEKPHRCSELHARARTLLEVGKFDDASRCCQESYRIGLGMGDAYIRAASRLYSGLILFALKEPMHWDRAADYCEESAALFHAVGERAAESAAWWVVAKIADTHTAAGYDRMQRALPAYLRVMSPEADTPDELESLARTAFRESVERVGVTDGNALPSPFPNTNKPPPEPGPLDGGAPEPNAAQTLFAATPPPVLHPEVRVRVGAPTELHVLSGFELFVLIVLVLDVIVVCGLAGWMSWRLLTAYPELRLFFLLGGSLILMATFVPIGILIGSGQFVFLLRVRQAAVLRSHGKLVAEERPGTHLIVPFIESLDAILPLARRRLTNRLVDISSNDGYSFLARVNALFRITDPAKVWAYLRDQVPHASFLGVPRGVDEIYIEQELDAWAYRLICDALHQLASVPALRAALQQGDALNRTTFALLEAETHLAGLQFYMVDVNPYHHSAPNTIPS